MEISNTESIPGRRIVEFYGVVTGNTVRAKHIGRDFMAGLKNLVGGELKGYTELLEDARNEARDRMIAQARKWGPHKLETALTVLTDTDLQLRSAGQHAPALALVERALIRLSMLAAR